MVMGGLRVGCVQELRNEMYMRQYEEAVGDQERSERLKHMAEAR